MCLERSLCGAVCREAGLVRTPWRKPRLKGRQGKVTEVVHSHLPAHTHAHSLRAAETHVCQMACC